MVKKVKTSQPVTKDRLSACMHLFFNLVITVQKVDYAQDSWAIVLTNYTCGSEHCTVMVTKLGLQPSPAKETNKASKYYQLTNCYQIQSI